MYMYVHVHVNVHECLRISWWTSLQLAGVIYCMYIYAGFISGFRLRERMPNAQLPGGGGGGGGGRCDMGYMTSVICLCLGKLTKIKPIDANWKLMTNIQIVV